MQQSPIKIFVISLAKAVERRNHIRSLFNKFQIDFEFIEAIDGSTIDENFYTEVNSKISDRTGGHIKKMIRNEIGCALSHISVYEKIKDSRTPSALIFEDDIVFDSRLVKFIQELGKHKNKISGYDLVLLGYSSDLESYNQHPRLCFWKRKRLGRFVVGKPTIWYWHAFSYYISYLGAQRLIENAFPLRMPADYLTTNCENYRVSFGLLKTPIVMPAPEHFKSTIGHRPQEKPIIKPILQDRNFIIKTINKYWVLFQMKLFVYTLRDNFLKIKLKLRILSFNSAKFYIKKF